MSHKAVVNRDRALTAARDELAQGAGREPTLRELLELLVDARWESALTQAELRDSLNGLEAQPTHHDIEL